MNSIRYFNSYNGGPLFNKFYDICVRQPLIFKPAIPAAQPSATSAFVHDDWSFNKQNITDVESCGVNNQRYFKEDKSQQQFLDSLMKELLNIKQN